MRVCLSCGIQEGLTKDHVVPRLVLRILLGREDYADFCSEVRKVNVQPLCGRCNNQKATRIIDFRTQEEHEQLCFYLEKYEIADQVEFEEPVCLVN